ncbi:MAG TPA: hypothetical protein VF669_20230 [Tepidisphaeraceae bacterium]|jgi:hypothetical protein
MTEQQDAVPQTEGNPAADAAPIESDEIVARADKRYRNKHLIFAIATIAFGLWFAYDGWIGWPKHNQEVRGVQRGIEEAGQKNDLKKQQELKEKIASMHKEYTETDILIQRLLALVLPAAGLAYGIWTLHATRGQYRLAGNTLEVPGYPPIDLVDIHRIDKTRWERKGIAVVHYRAHHPQRDRTFKLDDFAYERGPTDQIFERIDYYLAPPAEFPPESIPPASTEGDIDQQQT